MVLVQVRAEDHQSEAERAHLPQTGLHIRGWRDGCMSSPAQILLQTFDFSWTMEILAERARSVGEAGEGELAEQLAALPGAVQCAADRDLPAAVGLREAGCATRSRTGWGAQAGDAAPGRR